MQTIYKFFLKQQHANNGLYLKEDDSGYYLYDRAQPDKCIAAFGLHTKIIEIWAIADKYLKRRQMP